MDKTRIRPRNCTAWACAAAALLLTCATLICSSPKNRYTITSSLYPLDDRRPIRLSPDPGSRKVNIAFDRPARGDVMLIAATIAADDLPRLVDPAARFFLVPRDQTGRFDWEAARRIIRLYRNMAPTVFTQQIYLENAYAGANLVGWLDARMGAVELIDLRADFLAEAPSYRTVRPILIALWIALGLAILTLLLRAGERLPYVTVAILAGALLYGGTLAPKSIVRSGASLLKDGVIAAQGELRSLISSEPSVAPPAVPPCGPDQRGWLIEPEKLAHLCLCFILAFCMRRGFGSRSPIPLFFVLLAIAAATEVLQTMTVDRDPSIGDVGIDAMGLLAGLLSAHDFRRGKRPVGRYALKS